MLRRYRSVKETYRECKKDIGSVRKILRVSERYKECVRDIGSVRVI